MKKIVDKLIERIWIVKTAIEHHKNMKNDTSWQEGYLEGLRFGLNGGDKKQYCSKCNQWLSRQDEKLMCSVSYGFNECPNCGNKDLEEF